MSSRKKPIVFEPDDIHLQCEWDECEDVQTEVNSFIPHITEHVSEYLVINEKNTDGYLCHWRECNTTVFGKASDFSRHVLFHGFHTKIKRFGELLMQKSGSAKCQLESHTRNLIPELPERLLCSWRHCESVTDNPELFYRHVENHCEALPEGNNVKGGCACQWAGCNTVVKSKHKLKDHTRSHTQEKLVGCPTCGGLFSNRTRFFDHLERQADVNKQVYQCSHCNKQFSTERILRDHMRHHVNHYKCPFCDMTCPSPSSLRSHIKYRHSENKPYKCAHCEYQSKTASDLRKHIQSHNLDPSFYCTVDNCNFKARCYSTLAAHHLKKHEGVTGNKYACHVCEKVLSRGNILTAHLKRKHKFKWPSGHSRFRYKLSEDGFWRLQTVRYESIELREQLADNSEQDENESKMTEDEEMEGDEDMLIDDDSSRGASTGQEEMEEVTPNYNLEMLGNVALSNHSVPDKKSLILEASYNAESEDGCGMPAYPVSISVDIKHVP